MTGYVVERQISGEATFTEIARVPSTWRHFVDTLDHGTTASYRIRSISGSSVSGVSGSSSATATSPFGTWVESYGLSVGVDPGNDDDQDRLALLLEYALQRNPQVSDAGPWQTSLDSEGLTVSIPRSVLVYIIESSENLSDWEQVSSSVGGPARSLTLPFTPASAERYLRLTVLQR